MNELSKGHRYVFMRYLTYTGSCKRNIQCTNWKPHSFIFKAHMSRVHPLEYKCPQELSWQSYMLVFLASKWLEMLVVKGKKQVFFRKRFPLWGPWQSSHYPSRQLVRKHGSEGERQKAAQLVLFLLGAVNGHTKYHGNLAWSCQHLALDQSADRQTILCFLCQISEPQSEQ